MNHRILSGIGSALIAAAFLAGCGGGGGGGGGGIPIGFPPPVIGGVTLSGKATYDSVPNNSGPLVYSATTAKPVRGALVEVLDALSNQIAVTATDANGNYSVSVPANATIVVRVRAQIQTAAWDVSVRDNTSANTPLYSMQSAAFTTGSGATTRDLRADSGWGGSSYTGRRVSAPFAVLDTVYTSMQKVLSVAPATSFPPLKVFWSPNNVPTSGSLALGQIGSTFFTNRSTGREIYVLGKEDVDTDEFDAPVIAHEWGTTTSLPSAATIRSAGRTTSVTASIAAWPSPKAGATAGRASRSAAATMSIPAAKGRSLPTSASRSTWRRGRPAIQAGSASARSTRSSGILTSRWASSRSTMR